MKRFRKFLLLTFIFTILFAKTGIKSNAEGDYTLDIDLSSIEESDADILLWKVDVVDNINKQGIYKRFAGMTDDDISKEYGKPEIQTPVDKKVVFTGLDKGTYFIRDSRDNMKVSPVLISLPSDLSEGGNVLKIVLKGNHNEVIVKKLDKDTKNPLPGAEFKLLDENKNPVRDETFVTDENGQITISDLEYGKYIFHETKAPEGYQVDKLSEFTSFEVKSNITEVVIYNKHRYKLPGKKPKGSHSFVKVNDNKEALEGAVFKIMVKKNDKLYTLKKDGKEFQVTSGSDGKFRVENLSLGKYYLVEVAAPNGYKLLDNPIEFEIKENEQEGSIPVKFITNKKKGGKIPKTGDIGFIMIIASGLVLFVLGKYLTKKDNKKYQ